MGFVMVVEEHLTAVDARDIRLVLDKRARFERDQRRRGDLSRRADAWPR